MMSGFNGTLEDLQATWPHPGRLDWIGVRPARRQDMVEVESGIEGAHYSGSGLNGKRQVTLIQAEHLATIAALCKQEQIHPEQLRRNLVISGINIASLKDKPFRLGNAELAGTGYCYPCSRMEENLGPGGYNAVRGHGGITAQVIHGGRISKGDLLVTV